MGMTGEAGVGAGGVAADGVGTVAVGTGSPPVRRRGSAEEKFCGSGRADAMRFRRRRCPARAEHRRVARCSSPPGAGGGHPLAVLVVAPHPVASMAVVAPWMRIATLPPVDAIPLAYVASERGVDARLVRDEGGCPGAGTLPASSPHAARRLIVAPLAVT